MMSAITQKPIETLYGNELHSLFISPLQGHRDIRERIWQYFSLADLALLREIPGFKAAADMASDYIVKILLRRFSMGPIDVQSLWKGIDTGQAVVISQDHDGMSRIQGWKQQYDFLYQLGQYLHSYSRSNFARRYWKQPDDPNIPTRDYRDIPLSVSNIDTTGASVYERYMSELAERSSTVFLKTVMRTRPSLVPEQSTQEEILNMNVKDKEAFLVTPESAKKLNEITEIQFSDGTVVLSPWVILFTNLTSLILDSNDLKYLPTEIGGLIRLKTLVVTRNALRGLPDLSLLTALETLKASNNALRELPETIKYTALRVLDVSDNQLTTLPEGLASLTRLRIDGLSLQNNPIMHIPQNVLDSNIPAIRDNAEIRMFKDEKG
jgi:hypothetical protein